MINNRPAALSMLPPHVGASRSALAALQRDFARLRTLDHPNIARLIELGCNGRQYYVTAERLDGEPLRDVLTHLLPERLEVNESDEIVRAIGSALIFAHEHGIAHGDVRAENVMVTMDRRFVLTNFLARRVAKVSGRAPRPSDDVRGLARLAAELYTGSTSPQALRSAIHSGVPPGRLAAIRAILEAPNKKAGTVAEFLAAAGLTIGGAGARVRRAEHTRQRRWPLWRVALPLGGAVAIGAWLVSHPGDWRDSADQLQQRGRDVLRAVAAPIRPPDGAERTPAVGVGAAPARDPEIAATEAGPPSADAGRHEAATDSSPAVDEAAGNGSSRVADASGAAAPEPGPSQASPATDEPQEAAPPPGPVPEAGLPAPEPAAARLRPTAPTARAREPAAEPAVLSLGVSKIAAREDHSVVAIEVVRSGDTTREAAVGWWTTPDTAHADDDYAAIGRQTITFPAGATVERLLIPLVNDGLREGVESFTVHLSDRPRGGVSGAVTAARVTLHDDD